MTLALYIGGGVIGYCLLMLDTYRRLLWKMKQKGGFDPEFVAAMWTMLAPPVAICMAYIIPNLGPKPPRAIRKEAEAKEKNRLREARIRELEAETRRLEKLVDL